MTTLQKALAYLDKANFDKFFETLDKAIGKNTELAMLKKEFILNKDDAQFHERLRVFARVVLEALPTAHKFLTDFLKPTDFVGRQAELEQLHALLEAGEASVIVNGLGGVGKTTLARQYVQLYKENYHNIVWLEQQNTLLSALITNERLTDNMHFTTETEEDRFKRVMRELENTEGKNLLVIDNYEQKDTDDKLDVLERFRNVQFSHWRVLFTSREQVRRFQSIDLSFLPTHEAIELFRLHCENKPFDEKTLELLLEEVGKHTLTIELLAKTYSHNFDIERLEDLLTVLQQKEYDHALLQELIDTEHHKGYEPLYKHLLLLFDMEHWTDEEQYILKQFAVLPSFPIKAKQLLDWLQDEKRVYKNTLQNLARKGWLSTKDQQQYEMHRLLKVLIQKYLSVNWEDVKILVESIKEKLDNDKINANPLKSQNYVEYLICFLNDIIFNDNEIEELYIYFFLGEIYKLNSFYDDAYYFYSEITNCLENIDAIDSMFYIITLSKISELENIKENYKKSEELCLKVLEINKKISNNKNDYYFDFLNNLISVYINQNKFIEADTYIKKISIILKNSHKEKTSLYIIYLNNLSLFYSKTNKFKEAEKLLKKALNLHEKLFEKENLSYSNYLSSLAIIYHIQEKYKEAKRVIILSLSIKKKILDVTHHLYINDLISMCNILIELKEFSDAEKNIKKINMFFEKNSNEQNKQYALCLNTLAIICFNQEKYFEAKFQIIKSYSILSNIYNENDENIKNCKEWINTIEKALRYQTNTEL